MKINETSILGLLIIEPEVFGDSRGFFMESWNSRTFAAIGLDLKFVQDNHSRSRRGALRGLHFQEPDPQGKLIRVVSGAVWDVVVDLRANSDTFGQWVGVELTADNHRMFWVPGGFAHGFLTLADDTDFLYKCTAPYQPHNEHCLSWNDIDLSIDWPLDGMTPLLSEKDRNGLSLSQVRNKF